MNVHILLLPFLSLILQNTAAFHVDIPEVVSLPFNKIDKSLVNDTVKRFDSQLKGQESNSHGLAFEVANSKGDVVRTTRNFDLDVHLIEQKLRQLEALQNDTDPGFIIYDFGRNRLSLVDTASNVLSSAVSTTKIRGMYYNPYTQRVFAFTHPLLSFNMTLRDRRIINVTSTAEVGATGAIEGDPSKGELYLSYVSLNEIWKVGMDGSHPTKIINRTDTRSPLGMKFDTCTRTLYWADYYGRNIKSVKVDGKNTVTTLYIASPERPRGLDIDFHEQKLYWCGDSGKLFVFDMKNENNTQLDTKTSIPRQCDTLRLSNGFLYISHGVDRGIRKHSLNGTFIKMLFDGGLRRGFNKYFNLLQL